MTDLKEFDATALITIPKPLKDAPEEKGLLIHNRPELFSLLRETEGVDIHVSRGVASIRESEGSVSDVVRPVYENSTGLPIATLQRLGDISLTAYGVARSYGPPMNIEQYVEGLNPMNLRRFARHKHEVATTILQPLELYRQSILVTPESVALSESDVALGRQLVMKPNGGFASRDIVAGTPREIHEALQRGITEPMLVEERLNFNLPLPSIKGRDDYEQARLDEANRLKVNKELRMYSYGNHEWAPVARVGTPDSLRLSGDEWVYIDETSIPEEAIAIANHVKAAIDQKTGKTDTLLAVDLVYVTSESRPDPHWEVMEVNAEAYIMRPSNNGEVGEKHQRLLAAQIGRIARTNQA